MRGVGDDNRALTAQDAIAPCRHGCPSFPRDPRFVAKPRPVLERYERGGQGELLRPGDFVLCGDEKTQIRTRRRDPDHGPRARRPPPAAG